VTFDTLKFADTLKAAGVPAPQAEAEARAVADAFGEIDVATKRDVPELRAAVSADMDGLRRELQAVEYRLTIKLGTFLALAVGILAAILKL